MIAMTKQKQQCCGCGACAGVCPHAAIQMQADAEGFRYPQIAQSLCVDCGACRTVCPAYREERSGEPAPLCLGFQHGDRAILGRSASGGAFSALAALFWAQHPGGVVYGARLTENGTVAHDSACDMEQLARLRDSKYVESDAGRCYGEILTRLEQGGAVLFSGTPCQVYGLGRLAEKKLDAAARERLVLVDIVCNGVGSPLAWERFCAALERSEGQSLTGYTFRDKRAPRGYAVSWRMTDGGERVEPLLENRYWRMYQRGFISRPSCSTCPFTSLHRVSAVTIGDFHGLDEAENSFDIAAGVSLVLANTDAGRALCGGLTQLGAVKEYTVQEALQPRLQTPAPRHPLRNLVLKDLGTLPFEVFLKKYGTMIGEKKTV